jgi:hypothetical protein
VEPITFGDQLLRCEQCVSCGACSKQDTWIHSGRPAASVIFSCPHFDPIECVEIPLERVTWANSELQLLNEEDPDNPLDPFTCDDCVHSAMSVGWDAPICGEQVRISIGGDPCAKFAMTAESADRYFPIEEEDDASPILD